MALPKQVFENVSVQKFASICAKVKEQIGVEIDDVSGSKSGQGPFGTYEIAWAFDPTQQCLEIQCLKKPFVVPEGKVQKTIAGLVNG